MVTRPGATLGVLEAERLLAGPARGFTPLVLAAGEDDLLRERVVAAFRAGGEGERSEFRRLEGDDLPAEELAQTLAAISLFGEGRRIWIREGAKLERAAEEALLAWADGTGEGVRVLVTTSREPSQLKLLQSIAARGAFVPCAARGADARRWADRLTREAGLRLPGDALEALRLRAPNLLAWSRELEKLRVHADAEGRVPASALGAFAKSRSVASAERWAAAVLAGDRAAARAEASALDAEGIGGSACLWAMAERALAALDPPSYGYGRRGPGGPMLRPADARRALDAVYHADRALKSGWIRDGDIRDAVEQQFLGAEGA